MLRRIDRTRSPNHETRALRRDRRGRNHSPAAELALDYDRNSGRMQLSADELAGLTFPAGEPAAALEWRAGPSGIVAEAGAGMTSATIALGEVRIFLAGGLSAAARFATLSLDHGGSSRLAIDGLALSQPLLDILLPLPGLAPPPMRLEAAFATGANGQRLERMLLQAGAARIEAEGDLPAREGGSELALSVRAVGLAELLAAGGETDPEAILAARGIPASGEVRLSLTAGPDGLAARRLPDAKSR